MNEAELRKLFPGRTPEFYRRNVSASSPAAPGVKVYTETIVVSKKDWRQMRTRAERRKNDGRPWQQELLTIAEAYQSSRLLKMEKVDAPNRFVRGKIIPMHNPFPDFVGVWHRGSRMIAVEAKSTSDGRLGINVKSAGLTTRQVELLRSWHEHGAIAGVLWRDGLRAAWLPWPGLDSAVALGKRSVVFNELAKWDGVVLRQGLGRVTYDFAEVWLRLGY